MHRLWLRLAHHGSADLLWFNDSPRGADDLGIRNDAFVVEDLRIWDDSLPVDDAGFNVAAGLVDDLRLYNGLRSRHYVFVHHSSGTVDQLTLGHHSRRLLDGYEPWPALCRRAYHGTLRHTVQVMCCVCFWDTRIAEAPRSTRRRTGTLGFLGKRGVGGRWLIVRCFKWMKLRPVPRTPVLRHVT